VGLPAGQRLLGQQGASPHTVAGYRDTFRLLFHFVRERLDRAPSELRMEELDAAFLGNFSNISSATGAIVRGRETTVSRPYTGSSGM